MVKAIPEYVAVDLDGVILLKMGSDELAVLARVIGVPQDLLRHTMTVRVKENGLYNQLRSGELNSDEYWSWFFDALGLTLNAKEKFLKTLCSLRACDLEVVRLLERIRVGGIRTAVFSNNFQDNVELLDQHFGLRSRFDALVFSFDVGTLKPQPEFFCRAADRIGVLPDRIMVVDDHAANIRGAAQAGMEGILFRSAIDLDQELIRLGLIKGNYHTVFESYFEP